MATTLDIDKLRKFSPLDGLKKDNLYALLKKVSLRQANAGETLFSENDTEKRTVYLLTGSVELKAGEETVETLEGDTDAVRGPLSPTLPRQVTAVAANAVEYFTIDSELLDVMVTWDQTGTYEVGDLQTEEDQGTDDWMTTLLQTQAFHRIPPANIQAIFMRLQQINCSAGDTIIKQGDEGDYFYVITRGNCTVTRETPLNKGGIRLAELTVGDSFGEEALISGAKRNATVTMATDGTLMRLGNDDFQKLLNEPLLDWVSHAEAEELVANGGQWLDVRLPSEFEVSHEDGAINVPLYFLRLKLKTIDQETQYVVCCDTGSRSSAAAFILNERGYKAMVLRGGLNQSGLAKEASA